MMSNQIEPSRKKIMIVEDNLELRRLMRLTLAAHFTVLQASSGEQALDIVNQQCPDAVLLDVMLGGEPDGIEVLRRLRSTPGIVQPVVIMVSARGLTTDIESARALGADDYFTKPFNPLLLADRVSQLLN